MNDAKPTTQTTPTPQEPAPLSRATIHVIMMGIMLAMFLSALEQTIVAPALPTIGRTLGDIGNLSWVVSAYLLANTVATPLFGKLSDIHGRRRMMLIAISIFIVGSVACALAPNMPSLIAARVLQGIGGGGFVSRGGAGRGAGDRGAAAARSAPGHCCVLKPSCRGSWLIRSGRH